MDEFSEKRRSAVEVAGIPEIGFLKRWETLSRRL